MVTRLRRGFTLVELLVVMAIIATLLAIAAPRYLRHLEHAREAALKETLYVMRDAIDKYHGDSGRLPDSLQELVDKRYLRKLPVDPMTEQSDTWVIEPPPDAGMTGQMWNIHSGAPGTGSNGEPYANW
ncbi:MAG: prepilin-type N-terminal cleavage/methylation domain-containing protein [Rhodocyclaceae bacterium]|nr:prepilin-type N-terminal cleavage/methylation domain-containing protein [Rhodocyclaceae bacterium]